MMPPGGAALRAEQLATVGRIAHQKFTSPEIGKLIDGLRGWGEQQDYDSFEASLIRVDARRLGEGEQGAGGAARRDVALRRARESRLGRGAEAERLRGVPAGPAQEPRPAQALHRLLRGRRRAVRHRARRLRARHEDEGSARALRLPEGAPGAARQGGRGARRERAARPRLRDRAAEGLRARGRARLRLHRRRLAPRSDGAPVRVRHRRHRHPHHDALLQRAPRRPLRDDARVRARAVRAPGRPGARAHAARARRLARHARVAEPDVGEPRRPLAAVLAPLLPAAAGALPRRARRATTTSAGIAR